MPDGIIRDPVHNPRQCRYGVVCVKEGAGKRVLAVYDKNHSKNDLRHLPNGWRLTGELVAQDPPWTWCGIPIEYELVVEDANPGRHGVMAWHVERHTRGHRHFETEQYDPGRGGVIYPEPEE
jgi:hypothetical protein